MAEESWIENHDREVAFTESGLDERDRTAFTAGWRASAAWHRPLRIDQQFDDTEPR